MRPKYPLSLVMQCNEPGCPNRARVSLSAKQAFAPKGWLVMAKGDEQSCTPVVWCHHHAARARAKHSWDNWDETEIERELNARRLEDA